ncbi:bifunctional metallophosphatase/5'-nucleotidase [Jeotgalibacillus marinus]|uniref:Bifunctional UDP-sugar hydrolase/5'-nucleotidase n=1 Tax=Jeotgalibacillus marinus TaxID=86667 RepID=A0ABV3Q4X9_9BACL
MKKGILFFSTALLASLVMVGCSDDEQEGVTKGEFLTNLLDTMGVDVGPYERTDEGTEEETNEVTFTDVSDELFPYVDTAMRLDLVDENESEFGENEEITREEAYVLLIQSLNLLHDYDHTNIDAFEDSSDISEDAYGALAAAFELGIMEENDEFLPQEPLSEESMDTMMERYDENIDRMTIVATNDLHGRILNDEENTELGMAKIATIVEQIREENDDTFLFDIGDTFHGTNYVNFSEGESAVNLMNQMQYDAMVLGNHDFNFGQERMFELMEMAEFPVMSGNFRYEENDELITDPYEIIEVMGKEIALIAITAEDTVVKTLASNVEGLYAEEEVSALQLLVDEVKDEVDHIFVLSHAGYIIDKEMAEEVDGIDFILGGHTHDTLEYPELHNGTYITQAWEYGKALSINQVLFHEGELIGISGHLARDYEGLEEASDVKETLDEIEAEVSEELSEVIGSIDVDLDGDRSNVRTRETNLGNLITDAMRNLTGSDIAFTNGGGIRDSIPSGEVAILDVVTALPFLNFVIEIEVTGEQLLRSAEQGVHLLPEENGGFMHVSGMSFTYDPSQPEGDRVVELYVGDEEVDPEATYTAATNDFTASGGDGYEWLADTPRLTDTGEILNEIVTNYINEGHAIPGVEDRIKSVE